MPQGVNLKTMTLWCRLLAKAHTGVKWLKPRHVAGIFFGGDLLSIAVQVGCHLPVASCLSQLPDYAGCCRVQERALPPVLRTD